VRKIAMMHSGKLKKGNFTFFFPFDFQCKPNQSVTRVTTTPRAKMANASVLMVTPETDNIVKV
jgi:hypothetical protein